jgi:hypothetical protein
MMGLFKRKTQKLRKIVPNQDFLDEGFRFLKGKAYKVEINRARYFERNGWLEGSVAAPPDVPVELDIDDSTLGHQGGPK